MKIEQLLKRVMIQYGAMLDGWRLEVRNIDSNHSDWANVDFSITKPRKRKPCTIWNMRVNMATGYIDWEHTKHINFS